MHRRILSLLCGLLLCAAAVTAQDFTYRWTVIPVSSSFDPKAPNPVTAIVDSARSGMARLFKVVGHSAREMEYYRPESPLSNFTADALLAMGEEYSGKPADCAFYNMGGIRIVLPEGDITIDDIQSCYPFRNTLVIAEIKGSRLLDFLRFSASLRKPEAVAGMRIETDGQSGELISATVGGEEIDPSRTYRMVSISFLVNGGDGYRIGDYADSVTDTGIQVKEAMLRYVSSLESRGMKIDGREDGRYRLLTK